MTKNKRELLNDVLTGLLVAATFGAVTPDLAFAQLSTAVGESATSVFTPAMNLLSYASYGIGAVLVVAGIASVKKHTDTPANHTLGHGLGRLGAGAAFLAAPSFINMLQITGTNTLGGNGAAVQTVPFQ